MDVLDLQLCPWVTTPFPQQTDYGIDGDVKLTEYGPGILNPKVLGVTFQYQLKTKEKHPGVQSTVTVEVDDVLFWLSSNVPVVLFLALVDVDGAAGDVYWKCIDRSVADAVTAARLADPGCARLTIRFRPQEKFDRVDRAGFLKALYDRIDDLGKRDPRGRAP